jgi:hypothetical protein
MLRPKIPVRLAIKLLQLPKLFRERHAGEQGVDLPLDRRICLSG